MHFNVLANASNLVLVRLIHGTGSSGKIEGAIRRSFSALE
jgi:hypothetical protein